MDVIFWRIVWMIQFLKRSFRGECKEFQKKELDRKVSKNIDKIQNCNIPRKMSSFRSPNNLVEKYKVPRSIELVEMGSAPFSASKTTSY